MKNFFLLITFFSINSFGQSATPSPTPEYPTVVAEEGKPITFSFTDGREGQVVVDYGKPIVLDAGVVVFENECTEITDVTTPLDCKMQLPFIQDLVGFQWTQHPDSSKIGKLIPIKLANRNTRVVTSTPSDFEKRRTALTERMPSTTLICKDYSWLPGSQGKEAPEEVYVSRWELEFMGMNPETGLSELRSIGGLLGVDFKKRNNELFMSSVKKINGFFFLPLAQYGFVASLTLRKKDGASCSIVLQGDPNLSIARIGKLFTEAENRTPNFSPYIFGKDELIHDLPSLDPLSLDFDAKEGTMP